MRATPSERKRGGSLTAAAAPSTAAAGSPPAAGLAGFDATPFRIHDARDFASARAPHPAGAHGFAADTRLAPEPGGDGP